MRLGIFTLATSVYKNYFDDYVESLANLFPCNDVEKELFVMSDGLREYDGKQMFGCNIHWIKTIDFPYPILLCNKFQMVAEYMKEYDIEYGLYTDIDTIFFKKSYTFWEMLKYQIQSGKLICSDHPHYLFDENYKLHPSLRVTNEFSSAYVNHNIIDEHRSYIMTSFFAGTRDAIEEYTYKLYKMIGADLANLRWLATYVDESYFNKIYVEEAIIEGSTNIKKDKYITMNPYFYVGSHERSTEFIYENNFPEIETIFMNQKYNLEIKNIKKDNQV